MLKNKSKFKFITVIAVMIVSIMILTGCGVNNSNDGKDKKDEETKIEDIETESSFETPIKNYVQGLQTSNSDVLMKAFPPFLADELKENLDEETLKEMFDQVAEQYGEGFKISYEIKDKSEVSDEEIKEKQDDIKTLFNTDVKITKGYNVEVKLTTKGNKYEDTDTSTYEIYEIDGNWYMLM